MNGVNYLFGLEKERKLIRKELFILQNLKFEFEKRTFEVQMYVSTFKFQKNCF